MSGVQLAYQIAGKCVFIKSAEHTNHFLLFYKNNQAGDTVSFWQVWLLNNTQENTYMQNDRTAHGVHVFINGISENILLQ